MSDIPFILAGAAVQGAQYAGSFNSFEKESSRYCRYIESHKKANSKREQEIIDAVSNYDYDACKRLTITVNWDKFDKNDMYYLKNTVRQTVLDTSCKEGWLALKIGNVPINADPYYVENMKRGGHKDMDWAINTYGAHPALTKDEFEAYEKTKNQTHLAMAGAVVVPLTFVILGISLMESQSNLPQIIGTFMFIPSLLLLILICIGLLSNDDVGFGIAYGKVQEIDDDTPYDSSKIYRDVLEDLSNPYR